MDGLVSEVVVCLKQGACSAPLGKVLVDVGKHDVGSLGKTLLGGKGYVGRAEAVGSRKQGVNGG